MTVSDVVDSISTRALVLGMVRPDSTLHADELYDVAAACGFTVHQVRLCLARLVQEGMFKQKGRGRKALLTATAKGRRQLEPEEELLRLAWAQDAGIAGWDGQWHLIGFSIEEDRRSARNALREHLTTVLAAAPLFSGLYASAHPIDGLVREIAEDLGVEDRVLYARTNDLVVGGERVPRTVAARLWPVDDLARDWRAFVKAFQPMLDDLDADADRIDDEVDAIPALTDVVRIATALAEIIVRDPLLPPELLPPDWPGVKARALLVEANRAIGDLRDTARVPALFRRFDGVMAELDRGSRARRMRPN